jgi:hypothetical protein
MNAYLLALIALCVAFAVGYLVYGVLYREPLGTAEHKPEPKHLAVATLLLYLICLAFIYVFDHLVIAEVSAVGKGVLLGLVSGLGFFAFPLIMDGAFFAAKKESYMAVTLNWVLSFVAIGLVVGLWR